MKGSLKISISGITYEEYKENYTYYIFIIFNEIVFTRSSTVSLSRGIPLVSANFTAAPAFV